MFLLSHNVFSLSFKSEVVGSIEKKNINNLKTDLFCNNRERMSNGKINNCPVYVKMVSYVL